MIDDLTINLIATEGRNVTRRYADDPEEYGAFNWATVTNSLVQLSAELRKPQPAPETLKEVGNVLFQELIGHQRCDAYIRRSRDRGHTLRLRIHSDQPAFMAVPWEYLYDRESDQWLALHPRLSLVRGLPLPHYEPQPVTGPLRVLVMIAAPTDLPSLNSAREAANLEQVETTGVIDLLCVEPNYGALQDALAHYAPHVFHFIGHGAFATFENACAAGARHLKPTPSQGDPSLANQGLLAFCGPDGVADLIEADRLAPLLARCSSLRLVLLNACEGSVTGETAAFAGLTQRLIQQQLPSVIAMQASIVDDHAVRFSRQFYTALAAGYGVEQAVSEGRMRIHGTAYTWGIPTFYLQAAEPFAIQPLTPSARADLLWQKAQQSTEPARRRRLLEGALKLVPTHAEAQAGLTLLQREEEATQIYADAQVYIDRESWRDAYERLTDVERLVPNFRNTRRLWAQVKGQLDGALTYNPGSGFDQYPLIFDALCNGRLVPFLGWDISRFGRPVQDGWVQGLYPPVAEEVAQELAKRLPNQTIQNPSLPEISQYTTLLAKQWALYDCLEELYTADYKPTLLHKLLAELSVRLRDKRYPADPKRRLIIFSTMFDDLLEKAFRTVSQPYHLFVYHRADEGQGVQLPCFIHINPQDSATYLIAPKGDPETYLGHTSDDHPIIVKLCGHGIAQEPERLIITEDHFFNHMPQELGALLPRTLLERLNRSSLLFFGYSLRPWYFRLLWQRMRFQQRRLLDGGWAIVPSLSHLEKAFWQDQGIDPIQASPEEVIANINERLDRLEVRK